jgi:hypothetical protein
MKSVRIASGLALAILSAIALVVHNSPLASAVHAQKKGQPTAAGKSAAELPRLVTHSLEQPYLDQDLSSKWWDFGGDTTVDVNSEVRLTGDRPSQTGWLFSRVVRALSLSPFPASSGSQCFPITITK